MTNLVDCPLPLVTYRPEQTVIADGSRTGRLLILRKGSVAAERGASSHHIAEVAEGR